MAAPKIICLTKIERTAYNQKDKYFMLLELSNEKRIPVTVAFGSIEPLILDLHGQGISGSRRYDSAGDSHITEWDISLLK